MRLCITGNAFSNSIEVAKNLAELIGHQFYNLENLDNNYVVEILNENPRIVFYGYSKYLRNVIKISLNRRFENRLGGYWKTSILNQIALSESESSKPNNFDIRVLCGTASVSEISNVICESLVRYNGPRYIVHKAEAIPAGELNKYSTFPCVERNGVAIINNNTVNTFTHCFPVNHIDEVTIPEDNSEVYTAKLDFVCEAESRSLMDRLEYLALCANESTDALLRFFGRYNIDDVKTILGYLGF